MNIDLAALPADVDQLQEMVRAMVARMADDHRQISDAKAQVEKLRQIIAKLQRHQFGRKSERLDADQLALGLEGLDADIAGVEARLPAAEPDRRAEEPSPRQRRLPEHLPREDVTVDVEAHSCPQCNGALHVIGESVSEMLDFVPARFRVLRIRRPKYGCRACGTIHQAPAPERPITKGLASPGLLAHVITNKYCDHTPLYRQAQIFTRQGIEIERSTLANRVGGTCWWLGPLLTKLAEHVFASQKLFADDTPVPVLDPGRGRTRTGRLWVYARDDRPWAGPEPPAAVYLYSPDRKAERPVSHLKAFRGILQVDGYAGFERLAAGGHVQFAACWAHARRKFYDVQEATGSPIAAEVLRRIGELYAIEASIRGQSYDHRQQARDQSSRPMVAALKLILDAELSRISSGSALADGIRYALARWPVLSLFLDDGRVDLDNNPVERAIRPIALGRKNHLFAGSDGGADRWAIVCSLVETAKLNAVEPFAYLRGILQRMLDGHPASRLDDLLPWNWRPAATAN